MLKRERPFKIESRQRREKRRGGRRAAKLRDTPSDPSALTPLQLGPSASEEATPGRREDPVRVYRRRRHRTIVLTVQHGGPTFNVAYIETLPPAKKVAVLGIQRGGPTVNIVRPETPLSDQGRGHRTPADPTEIPAAGPQKNIVALPWPRRKITLSDSLPPIHRGALREPPTAPSAGPIPLNAGNRIPTRPQLVIPRKRIPVGGFTAPALPKATVGGTPNLAAIITRIQIKPRSARRRAIISTALPQRPLKRVDRIRPRRLQF